jgi:N-acetyl-anhydromuramoyl-L-alanine amidase
MNLECGHLVWQAGWLNAARRCDSPNFGPRPADARVELALIHSISLPPGHYGGNAIERLFTNQLDWNEHPYFEQIRGMTVSTHFLVRRDGELVQFVSCDQRAWHAGESVWQGRPDCNNFSIGIELEGLEGSLFEPLQYTALTHLIQALALQYPVQAVAGHEHVAPGRKQDPGAGFVWQQLQTALAWPDKYFESFVAKPT